MNTVVSTLGTTEVWVGRQALPSIVSLPVLDVCLQQAPRAGLLDPAGSGWKQ